MAVLKADGEQRMVGKRALQKRRSEEFFWGGG